MVGLLLLAARNYFFDEEQARVLLPTSIQLELAWLENIADGAGNNRLPVVVWEEQSL